MANKMLRAVALKSDSSDSKEHETANMLAEVEEVIRA